MHTQPHAHIHQRMRTNTRKSYHQARITPTVNPATRPAPNQYLSAVVCTCTSLCVAMCACVCVHMTSNIPFSLNNCCLVIIACLSAYRLLCLFDGVTVVHVYLHLRVAAIMFSHGTLGHKYPCPWKHMNQFLLRQHWHAWEQNERQTEGKKDRKNTDVAIVYTAVYHSDRNSWTEHKASQYFHCNSEECAIVFFVHYSGFIHF